ncbi:protein Jade-3 [Syngnathoides biaculeatus]|uniref:protein Jade-3 n=1 Tax=Syngnathoides biaculeatus TaxID=300417 RepID=UPI002ADD356B|nr:protein Jade-3 [Syngnathoides biaculeatus]XP_061680455.1 protein Jade-3 [Syngnathoides biaculeatus]XP_061680456.1 protein Jade-3 [Syngnathoides biaculeatus]
MKRIRTSSSSDTSDNESPSTSFCSNKYGSKLGTPAADPKKPAEVFRKDLISAMKLPDSHHIPTEDYYLLADTWKQEWEKGVQVLASPDTIPQASVRIIAEKSKEILYGHQKKYIECSGQESTEPGFINIRELAEAMCRYDLDDVDLYWLRALNNQLLCMGEDPVDELTMERTMEALEGQCHDNMRHAMETVEGLGIEYDEDVVCDVCRSPDSEEGNDMVFCDKCNICVHQACYGIVKVPVGNWLCRTCVLGIDPQCLLCPKKGGAMKATRAGTKWAHVSCALWIPEVSIACPERMEPITKVSHIPPSRWSLICSVCKIKTGACIQCSVKNCTTPFHVTCAFEHSLEMKTILDEGDEVKFKSYCLKHSKPKAAGETGLSPARAKPPPSDSAKVGLRAQRLLELEEEFYALVRPEEVSRAVGLSPRLVDFVYQYWKVKRKSNFNKALLAPKEDEENLVLQPHQDSIHTRMRMFMHLRQDLERVRNLCYMVSRREKLKLLQSKAQEQMFNLHVSLTSQDISAGLAASLPVESLLFRPPPRITLKLKMPKASGLGNCHTASKSANGPLCPDNSRNLSDRVIEGPGQGKPQLHGHVQREERANGRVAGKPTAAKPLTGKPLGLHSTLRGHSSNGKPEQERASKNGLSDKMVAQKDSSCQTPGEADAPTQPPDKGAFGKSAIEHFGRSFKEATMNLVRTTEDMRASDKLARKEKLWPKPVSANNTRLCHDSDGYCPDLELSDSEPEAKGRHRRQGGPPHPDVGRRGGGAGRGRQPLGAASHCVRR